MAKITYNLSDKCKATHKRGYDAAWEIAARNIASKSLTGIQVRCHQCHRKGTLISKWVRGDPIKPLYIVHANGHGHFKACLLDKENAALARNKIKITSKETIKTLRMGKPYVLFSGGKDSLCTLEYLRRLSSRTGIDITALHVNTTAGFPEVEKYVIDICKKMSIPLVVVKPDRDYFELAKKWGIPGVKSRWCCKTLKIAPIRRFLSEIDGPKVIYDGIRAAESNLRATYVPIWFHPSFKSICVSPIFGWSNTQIDNYIERKNLPKNPTYEIGTSGECWCGAYKCRSDFESLLNIHPEIFDKLVEVEEAQRGKYTFIYEKGKRIPLKSLRSS